MNPLTPYFGIPPSGHFLRGSIGKLVYDDELYDRITRAAANVEDATRKIRPILDDVRVFSDKIARDPGQLGVRGALQRREGGYKTSTPLNPATHETSFEDDAYVEPSSEPTLQWSNGPGR